MSDDRLDELERRLRALEDERAIARLIASGRSTFTRWASSSRMRRQPCGVM